MDNLFAGPLLPLLGMAAVLLLALGFIASRYKIAKSDEAYVITGRKGKEVQNPETGEVSTDLSGQKVVIAGGTFVWPVIQQADKISLRTRRINLRVAKVPSKNNVLLDVEGVALVKVGGSETAVRQAAQRFRSQQEEIESFATETLTGSLRAIIGTLDVDAIIRDRTSLAERVKNEAEATLTNQGLVLDTLQIQSVGDDSDYIVNLGRPEAARVQQEAKIAEADAQQAIAERESLASQKIAEAQKELALKRASIQVETDKATAAANASGPLAKAAQDQNILQAEELVAERQVALTARELEATVNKRADADLYQAARAAEAAKTTSIAAAQADAEATRLQAAAYLERKKAEAEATRVNALAEAEAIQAKGEAEAEALLKKAEAFKQYNDAAVTQMVVDMLPQVAGEIAKPLASIQGMTVISNDGASKLTQTTTDVLTQTLGVAKDLTGVDFLELIQRKKGEDTSPQK